MHMLMHGGTRQRGSAVRCAARARGRDGNRETKPLASARMPKVMPTELLRSDYVEKQV
jgi:hypothetical protein